MRCVRRNPGSRDLGVRGGHAGAFAGTQGSRDLGVRGGHAGAFAGTQGSRDLGVRGGHAGAFADLGGLSSAEGPGEGDGNHQGHFGQQFRLHFLSFLFNRLSCVQLDIYIFTDNPH
ncbi:MAG: hypothetical protein H6767_02480 [Candidatus Peribacteria bacterium]|nr:MAG: hypothetical protein H6767_02480 [Candidatus Peribacteria bacterium]